jgi:serine phosphatase RsbU (regulator of sigma subunit)
VLRQRDDLEQKNELINNQIEIVQSKNKEITDSINYAQRIQRTLLPLENRLNEVLSEHFVFYQPRNIVSGDFYWFHHSEETTILAVGDCVGHGVPGAFMTVMGNALLNEIVIENGLDSPLEIVSELNKKVYNSLRSHAADPDAGGDMDIAVIKIDQSSKTIQYTGAKIPVNFVYNGQITQIRPDKFSIGAGREPIICFSQHEFAYQPGTMLYLTSDGYSDQFGGTDLKKFMTKNYRAILSNIADLPCKEQKLIIENEFFAWKGNVAQTDDVLVVGIRL